VGDRLNLARCCVGVAAQHRIKKVHCGRRSSPDGMGALVDLVRSMNCYYNNLIEGHDTHSVAIDRALGNDFSPDPRQRDLQMEAKAHIEVRH